MKALNKLAERAIDDGRVTKETVKELASEARGKDGEVSPKAQAQLRSLQTKFDALADKGEIKFKNKARAMLASLTDSPPKVKSSENLAPVKLDQVVHKAEQQTLTIDGTIPHNGKNSTVAYSLEQKGSDVYLTVGAKQVMKGKPDMKSQAFTANVAIPDSMFVNSALNLHVMDPAGNEMQAMQLFNWDTSD